jgi:hypothetical protein
MADTTDFATKCEILGDVWIEYRTDEGFKDFIEYNDLGLPLAYAFDKGIVPQTEQLENIVEDTFTILLAALGMKDEGFDSMNDLFDRAEQNNQ